MMGALAEMERELIVERTLAGLAAARAQGRVGGRRPKLTKNSMSRSQDCSRKGMTESGWQLSMILDCQRSTATTLLGLS